MAEKQRPNVDNRTPHGYGELQNDAERHSMIFSQDNHCVERLFKGTESTSMKEHVPLLKSVMLFGFDDNEAGIPFDPSHCKESDDFSCSIGVPESVSHVSIGVRPTNELATSEFSAYENQPLVCEWNDNHRKWIQYQLSPFGVSKFSVKVNHNGEEETYQVLVHREESSLKDDRNFEIVNLQQNQPQNLSDFPPQIDQFRGDEDNHEAICQENPSRMMEMNESQNADDIQVANLQSDQPTKLSDFPPRIDAFRGAPKIELLNDSSLANAIRAHGFGLEKLIPGINEFTLNNVPSEGISVHIIALKGNIPIPETISHFQSNAKVTFSPINGGDVRIDVSHRAKPIPFSPFTVPGWLSDQTSFPIIEALANQIIVRNIKNPHDLIVKPDPKCDFVVKTDPQTRHLPKELRTHFITFQPTVASHTIHLSYFGELLPKSPLIIRRDSGQTKFPTTMASTASETVRDQISVRNLNTLKDSRMIPDRLCESNMKDDLKAHNLPKAFSNYSVPFHPTAPPSNAVDSNQCGMKLAKYPQIGGNPLTEELREYYIRNISVEQEGMKMMNSQKTSASCPQIKAANRYEVDDSSSVPLKFRPFDLFSDNDPTEIVVNDPFINPDSLVPGQLQQPSAQYVEWRQPQVNPLFSLNDRLQTVV